MSHTSSAPTFRPLALVVIVLGAALIIVSLFADPLGVSGGGEGFGFKQLIAVIAGLVMVFGGIGWLLRPILTADHDEPFE